MSTISDKDIHDIVERVVRRTLAFNSSEPPAPTPTIPTPAAQAATEIKPAVPAKKVVAIGTDHGGVDLKTILVKELTDSGYEVIDCGTNTKDAVDYPDIALAVAQLVAGGKAWRGVVIDGAGIGSCMAANKVPGIRAAMCYDYATAVNSREHNDANVLTLGAGLIGVNLAKQILATWLTTEFGGGRHAKRVDKIIAIEKSYLKDRKAE
jgi:ribose 5-phosphate isomerase B